MALPDYFKVTEGTAKTIKSTGGTAAMSFASVANGNGTTTNGQQSASLDFGTNWAQRWRMESNLEIAATPTAGNSVNYFGSWNTASGTGMGNTSGANAPYSGYAANLDASTKHLEFMGAHICSTQATPLVQKAFVGIIFPKGRHLNLVLDNRSGAALHSTETNQVITFTPLEESMEDTV